MHTHNHIHHNNPQTEGLMRIATYAAVGTALMLVAVKFYAWLATDSVSIMTSLADSGLDVVISLINFFAIRYALEPPDEEHRFGHSGAEDVAALAQSAFVAGSAMLILISAVQRLFEPQPVEQSSVGIAVMGFSIIATLLLVLFQRYVVRRTGSTAIGADSLHYLGDLLMNAAVIVAIILSDSFGIEHADPVLAAVIALYIAYGAWRIGKLAFDKLMDKEMPEDEQKKIEDFVLGQPGVLGMHNLKTRYSGIKPFIQFHLDLNGNQTLFEAHEIADSLEHSLMEMFPGGEVIIHEDPVEGKAVFESLEKTT